MKHRVAPQILDNATALVSRRRFLKKALMATAYATPIVLTYSSAVFASHCSQQTCGGINHMWAGQTWSPGCRRIE